MFPNPVKLLWSWIVNRYAHVRGFRVITTTAEAEERLAECRACEEYNDGICSACSCLTMAKVILTTEQCPKRKWARIWSKYASN